MRQKNLLEYLENILKVSPDKTAYESYDGREIKLSFREVSERARSIGTALINEGAANEPVLIFMERTPLAITAFFGTLYAGCYYVPVDPDMPVSRIDKIIANLKPRFMISEEATSAKASESIFDGRTLGYEDLIKAAEDKEKLQKVRDRMIDTDPAYVVYTSGSTGTPKGIVACHRSVIDYIENLSEVLEVSSGTRFGNQSPFCFDACLKEIYPTIRSGASAVMVPRQLFSFPVKLIEFLNDHEINTVCWVVSALTMVSALGALENNMPHLKTVAFGSEVLKIKEFNKWRKALPDARFINLYGPTEATGMSTYYIVDRDFAEGDTIPVGRPFDNTRIILLDDEDKLSDEGEICICGTCLTPGYINAPELTDKVFTQNPLNVNFKELIYRTGDIGRMNEKGELLFVSRKDSQIKHMGHRIELGEIEETAGGLEGTVLTCALFDREKDRISLVYSGSKDIKQMREYLKENLPAYMLPARTVRLDEMPLTPNGKIDRKKLEVELNG